MQYSVKGIEGLGSAVAEPVCMSPIAEPPLLSCENTGKLVTWNIYYVWDNGDGMNFFFCKNRNAVKNIVILGLAYVTGLALALVHGYGITGIEVIVPCLIALAAVVYFRAMFIWENTCRRDWIMSGVVGFVFALTVVLGSKVDHDNGTFADVGIMDAALYPFLGLFFGACVLLLFGYRDKWSIEGEDKKEAQTKTAAKGSRFVSMVKAHPFLALWVLNVMAYLPYYLTFFPGNCGPDTWESVRMALGEIPWTNHHPVLFTGLLLVVIKLTGFLPLTASIGVFSFLQMLSLAAVLAYMTVRICKMKVVWPAKAFAVLMCAFHPFLGMYSVYLTKDVVFAEIVVLLCLALYDVVKTEGRLFGCPAECVKLAVLFLLSSMLRNNGIYIAVVMGFVFLFLYRRYLKQILIVFVCVIGLFRIWYGPVFTAIGIEKQSFAEAASIPLQQVGYVLWQGKEFAAEDMAFLEKLMPVEKVKEVYEPGYTDPYKFDEEFDDDFLNENVGEFLSVWSHGLTKFLPEYIEAYLHQTAGYWHYGATNSICMQGITENTLSVEQTDVIGKLTGISTEPLFEKMILAGRKAPVVCVLGSMAMQMFMVLLLILQYVRAGKAKQGIYLIPLVILWGTIMVATPAFCLLRYLFPVFMLWPFMIAEFMTAGEAEVV